MATSEATRARSLHGLQQAQPGLLTRGPCPQQVLADHGDTTAYCTQGKHLGLRCKQERQSCGDRAAGRRRTPPTAGSGQGWPTHLPDGTREGAGVADVKPPRPGLACSPMQCVAY